MMFHLEGKKVVYTSYTHTRCRNGDLNMSDEHKSWNYRDDWHKGNEYGCYFKHANTTKYKNCDYRLNGFDVSKDRSGMYNRDHRQAAVKRGYLTPEYETSEVKGQVDARASAKKKDSAWKDKFRGRIYGSFQLLAMDKNAWHIKHKITSMVTPWWGKATNRTPQKPPAENFLPKTSGGWHYYFPYKHNHHHMISAGSFKDYVIYAPTSGEVTPFKRAIIVLKSNWNINRKSNMVLLPNEEAVADTAQLPAHCPWDTASHPDYSKALKSDLKEVMKSIDKAANTKGHDELEDVTISLKETEDMLLDKLKSMRGPL